ncbi:MAG: transcriptional regulator [Bacteroidia bacterium]|nr:transcriptional regulator [Bacteroidia bacterium]
MKEYLSHLNKDFENRYRLGIMSLLMVHPEVDFNTFKETLRRGDEPVTDGNLASHLSALEKKAYLVVKKQFVGRKPNTTYTVTPAGKAAFEAHLQALEQLIRGVGT